MSLSGMNKLLQKTGNGVVISISRFDVYSLIVSR